MGNEKAQRITIPSATRQIVLLEAGYKCANPSCRHILTLELHHIVWVKDGGGNDADNLVALCPNCHSLHTAGHIPADAIRCWKNLLVSLNSPSRASADILLVLHQEEQRLAASNDETQRPPPFRFTGDGLGMLSSLLVSGLVEISRRFSGAGYFGGGMPSFEVSLTSSGRRLVEAWLTGKPEAVASALSSGKTPEAYQPQQLDRLEAQ
jgi:hypothetical protein